MKPLFKINVVSNSSFTVKNTIGQSFDGLWHYHNEYELSYIHEGRGEKIVGDHISSLNKGELLFLGSDLPHRFSCDQNFPLKDRAGSLTVHINSEFINERFFTYPELASISQLFNKARSGVQFNGKTQGIASRIQNLFELDEAESILEIVSMFQVLSKNFKSKILASPGYTSNFDKSSYQRINKVCKYVMDNFKSDICLEDAANIVGLTNAAFCRHFKKVTGKTFFSYIKEYRVGNACKLLMENNLNVSEISYECGFNTISNFNKQFREITGNSPSVYRDRFINFH
ncbi:MAG: AraC family transcriptional regulator [Balneolales bacterium]